MSVLRGWDFSPKEMIHLYLQFVSVVGLLLICRSVAYKASTLLRLRTILKSLSGFSNEKFLRDRSLTHRPTPTWRAKLWNSSCLTPKLCPARFNPPRTEVPTGTPSRTQTSSPRYGATHRSSTFEMVFIQSLKESDFKPDWCDF